MKTGIRLMALTLVAVLGLLWSSHGAAQSDPASKPRLYFVIVNPEIGSPETVLSSFKPLLQWMSDKIKRRIEVIILPDVTATVNALHKGEADMGYTGIIDFFNIQKQFSIKPMVTIVKDKSTRYTACLVVHRKNEGATLQDLPGKSLGYTSFHKAIGGLFPQIVFQEKGMGASLDGIFSEVRPYYSDISAIRDLVTDKIFCCSISQSTLETLAITSPGLYKNLHVLVRLEGLMFAPFFYRSDLDEALKEKCIEEVLAFSRTIEGRQLLMMFKVDGIARVTDEDYLPDRDRAVRLGYIKK